MDLVLYTFIITQSVRETIYASPFSNVSCWMKENTSNKYVLNYCSLFYKSCPRWIDDVRFYTLSTRLFYSCGADESVIMKGLMPPAGF